MKMRVRVGDDIVEVDVDQLKDNIWIASGDYAGRTYKTKGSSPSSAAKLWSEAARHRGN